MKSIIILLRVFGDNTGNDLDIPNLIITLLFRSLTAIFTVFTITIKTINIYAFYNMFTKG